MSAAQELGNRKLGHNNYREVGKSGLSHLVHIQKIVGSNPTLATNNGLVAHLGEHLLCKQGVVGSSPTWSTNSACGVTQHRVHGGVGSSLSLFAPNNIIGL